MKEIKLTQGQVSLVDDEDFEYLNQWKWCAHKDHNGCFYAVRRISTGKQVKMHRVIMGVDDPKVLVDHINLNTLINTKDNLRRATKAENNRNVKSRKGSSSKYIGVVVKQNRHSNINIRAYITFNSKTEYLGTFITEEAAARYRDAIAIKYFGEFASLNFK